jgi:hypothetical protein
VTIVTPRGDFAVSIAEPSPRGGITPLIASKLLRADVIIIDARIVEHGSARLHHRGWSGDVIHGTCGVGNSRSKLAMENARAFPSASLSIGSTQEISVNWPALNTNPAGLSNSKAIVRSATMRRLFSFNTFPDEFAAVDIVAASTLQAEPSGGNPQ